MWGCTDKSSFKCKAIRKGVVGVYTFAAPNTLAAARCGNDNTLGYKRNGRKVATASVAVTSAEQVKALFAGYKPPK